MDLVALEIFCAVAEEGSVTRAAERLGRAQSSVTTRLQQLEEQLGTPLFNREGRRLLRTPEGDTLLAYARRLLALAEEAQQALRPSHPSGRLRLGAMESTAAVRLPVPLAQLHAQWPDLLLDLRTAPSRQLVELVLAHELDAALVAWPPPPITEDDPALTCTPVYTEALRLALPASHVGAALDAPLSVHTLAAFARGCTYRQIGEATLQRANGMTPQVLELASYPAILALVAAGRCAAVVPQMLLDSLRAPPPLIYLPLQACTTMLVTRSGYQTPALAALQAALLQSA